MRKFEENNILEDSVKNDNLIEIKAILLDVIMVFRGNKEEITQAVNYAIANSSFEFEPHDDRPITSLTEDPTAYTIESYNMVVNFSKERYYALIDLYLEKDGNDNNSLEDISSQNLVMDDLEYDTEEKAINYNYIMYGAVALAIGGYIVYKLVD